MIEKVNPSHPDKVADRIAGAIVDLAYKKQENPKIAVEVLIGHENCHIIAETSVSLNDSEIWEAVWRIAGSKDIEVDYEEVPQDVHLAENQSIELRCGDNGIFKGVPVDEEEHDLSEWCHELYMNVESDGKFIYDKKLDRVIACQSNMESGDLAVFFSCKGVHDVIANPLGFWTGGTNVDTGATNRKLGSDMGRAVTGGGLHGKDLSKADVSVNIACHIMAQSDKEPVEALCAIGDSVVSFSNGKVLPYSKVIEMAREYIEKLGGFEKLAEWGLF